MIGNLVIYIVFGIIYVLSTPFLLLPDVSLDSSMSQGILQASDSLGLIHSFLPNTVNTLLTILVLMVSFEVIYYLWKFINWLIRKIPGIS